MSALPHVVQTAWGLNRPGTRGPKRGLCVDRIVDVAVDVADREGVSAISMARVAKELGFTTMSLYRYVESKDDLIELMVDRALGSPPAWVSTLGWREALERCAVAEYEVVSRHGWWVDLPIGAPPRGPNNLAWLDHMLRCLAPTGLPEGVKVGVAMNLSMYVIGRVRLARELAASAGDPGALDYATVLPTLLERSTFPALLSAAESGAFGGGDPSPPADWEGFRFGLDLMLDGLEEFVRKNS
ncbi:MAG: TetR/AcrR family transcriptional regulator [Rhodococcus sp.]|nr:TetR/AcrR family transcriptional regulator [Rhodococcus sp. (in: high G+C Gram-positive bacteria)]